MDAPVLTPMVSSALVGRAPQLDLLDRMIEQVKAGHGQTTVIGGEAGIGKSRLVLEATTRAATHGLTILRGRCFETDRTFPYAPLIDLLRTYLAAHPPATHPAESSATIAELIALLPELDLRSIRRDVAEEHDPEQGQRRLFVTLLRFLVQVPPPSLIVVEDLHWSDEGTLAFLLFLLRRLAPHPAGLLLSYRPDDVQPPLATFLTFLRRERIATEVQLDPLSEAGVAALVRGIFGLQQAVRADFLDALYVLTEGNPLFVEEVLSTLVSSGDIFYANGSWDRKQLSDLRIPHSIQVAVQRRLDLLSDGARDVVILAAVAGRRFDFALLQALTSHTERELLGFIKELIRAGLVVEESADTFAFRHALTREAVRGDLLARERRALHNAVALAIESVYAGSLDARLADLAYHFDAAECWEPALEYARRAADHARARYAPRAAVAEYTRAIAAMQRLRLEPIVALFRARGQTYEMLGELDAAREDYLHVLEIARDDEARWQGLLDLGWLSTGRDYQVAGSYLQRALQLARDMGDPAILAGTLNRVGNWYANIEQPGVARQYHEEALALYEDTQDLRGQATTLDLLGTTGYVAGTVVSGAHYFERAAALFRALDDRQGLSSCLANAAMRGGAYVFDTVVLRVVSAEACVRDSEEAVRVAREIGWRAGEAAALMYTGLAFGPRGDYARVLAAAHECLRIASDIEHHQWTLAGHWTLGAILLDLLAFSEACSHLEQALEQARAVGHCFSIQMATSFLASTHIARHDLAAAERILADAGRDGSTPTLASRLVRRARAELAIARGDPEQGLSIVEELIASATAGHNDAVVPTLWYLRGKVLAALGRLEEAGAALDAACDVARDQGARSLLWRASLLLGQVRLAQRLPDQAEELFASARACVEALAANVPDETMREMFLHNALAQLPLVLPPSPRRAAKRTYDGLTEREREIAALIREGKTNRQIAGILILSPRTVQVHIANIMSKLDVTSRTQIAAWAVTKGLEREPGRQA